MSFSNQKQALENKQNELLARINGIEADLKKPHSADSAEQAQERENDEVLAELLREAREEMVLVDRSLKRIDSGSYGKCESCGDVIAEARLEAYPVALHCIQCAS